MRAVEILELKSGLDVVSLFLFNEKGLVLPVALMFLTILSVMGGAAFVFTRTDLKIANNYKNGTVAFALAEAGVAVAKQTFKNGSNWNIQLAGLASQPFGCPGVDECSYRIENDPAEPGGTTTDTNNTVIIKATG